jgi:hypothetical protein
MGLFISLAPLVSADSAEKVRTFIVECQADISMTPHSNGGATAMRVHSKQADLLQQGLTYSPKCNQASCREALADILVQAMGNICITPAGRCDLSEPGPINSRCCCPGGACGYIGR